MSLVREMRQLVAEAEAQGFVVVTTGGNHLRFTPPDKSLPFVITASTPSDGRAFQNIRASLRRIGFHDRKRSHANAKRGLKCGTKAPC